MVLGIETSSEFCAIALVEGGQCVAEQSEKGSREQSARLMPMIDGLLSSRGLSGSVLEGLAVSQGPGSFTGLRVGMSLAKGLALGWQKPLVGVGTLRVLMDQIPLVPLEPGHPEAAVALVDAKRGEVYAEWYERTPSGWRLIHPGACEAPAGVIGRMEAWHGKTQGRGLATVTGNGVPVMELMLKERAWIRTAPLAVWIPKADTVTRLGERMILANQVPSLTEVVPLYLREPPISRPRSGNPTGHT